MYRFEQGIDPVHGGLHADTLFSTRNTFVGVDNARFGTLLVGTHDTPLKKAQGDIDLFNNQLGDIEGLVPGEVRARDSVLYRTPAIAGATVTGMYVPGDDDFGNSWSVSMAWSNDAIDFAIAADSDMRKNDRPVSATAVYDAYRASARTHAGEWAIGVLGERSRREPTGDWEHALIVSAGRPIGPWQLDFQWGRSTIGNERTQWLAGISRQFASVRLYGFVSHTLNDNTRNDSVLALGIEYKFR
ncbi:MAG: porin [Gammaproteobacteria bacterium]|nr:porin [Gammaproteobacteria bacterium]